MAVAVVPILLAVFLAQPAMAEDAVEVLTNEDIVVMTEAGLEARVIVAKIMATEGDFDIAREELVALSRAGVEGPVLEAMVLKTVPTASRRAPETYAERFEGTPCPGPGLYVEEEGALRGINPVTPQIWVGNRLLTAVTWGVIPTGAKAAIRGARSDTRTHDRSPTFWFCPEDLEYPADPRLMVDPREFLLVVFKSSDSREERSLDMGGAGYGGQTGVPSRSIRRAMFESVGLGVYRITPRSPLKQGEYGFYHAGEPFAATGMFGGGGKIYDFGVDG